MYLSLLDNEKKHLFLDLELYMSCSDGEFSIDEKNIIDVHCLEMEIDNNNYQPDLPKDLLLNKLKTSLTIKEKKIFILELMAVVLADGDFHENEHEIMLQLAKYFNFKEEEIDKARDIIQEMKLVYSKCASYITC